MNIELMIVLAAVAVGGVVLFFWSRKRAVKEQIWDSLDGCGIPKSNADLRHSYTTPGGARVMSTVAVPTTALADIDTGISNQIHRHDREYPHWANYRNLSDYDVVLIDPMAINVENEPGAPSIFVSGVQTAGTCIGVQPRSPAKKPYIIAPHQEGQGWRYRDYFMRTIWHESEHVRERQNDIGIFLSYTGANDVHPHVP